MEFAMFSELTEIEIQDKSQLTKFFNSHNHRKQTLVTLAHDKVKSCTGDTLGVDHCGCDGIAVST